MSPAPPNSESGQYLRCRRGQRARFQFRPQQRHPAMASAPSVPCFPSLPISSHRTIGSKIPTMSIALGIFTFPPPMLARSPLHVLTLSTDTPRMAFPSTQGLHPLFSGRPSVRVRCPVRPNSQASCRHQLASQDWDKVFHCTLPGDQRINPEPCHCQEENKSVVSMTCPLD